MILNIYSFNNYYNRIVKRYDSLLEYGMPLDKITGVNFNPNDGISTEVIINYRGDVMPDYLVATDDRDNIVSRWYIIESGRTRAYQFRMQLYRDVISDHLDVVKNAPAFIEKGYVNVNDSAIFNSEAMTFNQIKRREIPLIDETKSAWIVGYVATPKEDEVIPDVEYGVSEYPSTWNVDSLANWDPYKYTDTPFNKLDKLKLTIRVDEISSLETGVVEIYSAIGGASGIERLSTGYVVKQNTVKTGGLRVEQGYDASLAVRFANTYLPSRGGNSVQEFYESNKIYTGYYIDNKGLSYSRIKGFNGEILAVGDGNKDYYRVRVIESRHTLNNLNGVKISGSLQIYLNGWVDDVKSTGYLKNTPVTGTYSYEIEYTSIKIELIPLFSYEGKTFKISNDRRVLDNSPYCLFCMPYGDYTVGGRKTIPSTAIQIASGISRSIGSFLYDIQLLPYCPHRVLAGLGNRIQIDSEDDQISTLTKLGFREGVDYQTFDSDTSQILFWVPNDSGSFDIPLDPDEYLQYEYDPITFKVKMGTRFIRMCSPNYNGVFEINPQRNGGISSINVDYTYKPYSPYIHLNPNFGALYGQDYNDARGLILGGDFSLASTSDAWKNYEIQNKNYQVIFDRQIENMEINQSVARTREIVGAVSGTVQGAATGAAVGTTAGPVGAMIGTVAGTISAGAGGVADVYLNDKLRNEAIDYTRDQFGASLDNIKALPYSLSRVTAYNANNKIYPFIECYSATPEEESALRDKIKYNGMTINRIGTIQSFLNQKTTTDLAYFKAKMIRLEGLGDDSHIAQAIANEMNKGVYI